MKASLGFSAMLAVCMLGLPSAALATEATLTIKNIRTYSNGIVTVYFNGSVDYSNCKYSPSDSYSWLNFDSTTAGGKAMLETLLTRRPGNAVYIGFTGGTTCTLYFIQF